MTAVEAFLFGLGIGALLQHLMWLWDVKRGLWVKPMLILAIPFLLGGCVASNLADVVKELGDNTSTVCVTVNTVYGTGKALRSNVASGKVKCDMDGMSIDNTKPVK